MFSGSELLGKISDRLESRDKQTNFGICKQCKKKAKTIKFIQFKTKLNFSGDKKVYWSSSKVASHIRSGHCSGASEEEVQQFKQEFVYDTPKNLVHKSALTKKFKENFEIEEFRVVKESPRSYSKRIAKQQLEESPEPKRAKIEMIDEYEQNDNEEIVFEEYNSPRSEENGEEKLEIVFLPDESREEPKESKIQPASSSPQMSKEDKFIDAVYPQFKGKTKLELIEHILDLKRRNEMLQTKAKTYENTINRLLN